MFPVAEAASYLIRGLPKGVPVTLLVRLLRRRANFIRVIHFGMKQPIEDFPFLPLE